LILSVIIVRTTSGVTTGQPVSACHCTMIDEKGDSAELVLDGQLLGERIEEVNLAELLRVAEAECTTGGTIPEDEIERDWPALRDSLRDAYLAIRCNPDNEPEPQIRPDPIITPESQPESESKREPAPLTQADLALVMAAVSGPVAKPNVWRPRWHWSNETSTRRWPGVAIGRSSTASIW